MARRRLWPLLQLLLLLSTSAAVLGYEAPDDCELNPPPKGGDSRGGFSLTCHLSAINSDTERTNFSVIPSKGTSALTVRCSDTSAHSALEAAAFADLSELRELAIVGCRLAFVPRGAFLGLEKLEKLVITTSANQDEEELLDVSPQLLLGSSSSSPSLTVEEGAFSGLPSLRVLQLSGNGLRSLPPSELCQLPLLSQLDVSGNRLASLRDVADPESADSDCLGALRLLDASDNEISTLESSDLPSAAARGLEELRLASNFVGFVSSLPAGASLRSVDLSGNRVASLPADIFANASRSLKDLLLANNSISELEEDALRGLTELRKLDLSGNSISSLGKGVLSDLSSLLELDLSSNRLENLGGDNEGLFASTLRLEALRLDGNRLETLPSPVFSPLRRLQRLDLSSNSLREIVGGPLPLPELTHLHLSGNGLSSLPDGALSNCTSVLVLDLSRNSLRAAPAALAALRDLQTLDLSRNGISSLEGAAFLRLPGLWRLQLSHNRVSNVSRELFSALSALQVLDLSSNAVSRVERGAFDGNQKLQALRLDANRLTDMEGLFQSLPDLSWLNVSDNAIGSFDYGFLPRSLHWLDVSHNLITELGNSFRGNDGAEGGVSAPRLRELKASFNRLSQLGPGSVPDGVEILLVNDNAISQVVPYTFFKKTRLRKVDLSVNELRSVDRNALRLSSDVSRLPDFYLGGNPVECDCEMAWFKGINSAAGSATQNYPIIQDIESIYCRLVYTREVSYVPLVEARNEQFLCPYETHCFALCKCCDFDACDCEMSCPDNCTCYHDNSWSKNIAVCSAQGFNDLPEQLPMDATEIFLDGNDLTELDSHTFIGRKNLRVLHLNASGIQEVQNKTFNGLKSLSVLHLEDNRISSLRGYEFEGLTGLRELYLQNNEISFIADATFKYLRGLEVLHLHGNRIIDFPVWGLTFNPFLVSVRLAENLWSCDCEYMERFRSWMSVSSSKIFDAESVACVSNEADSDNGEKSTAVANVRMSDFDVSTCTGSGGGSMMHSVQATTRVQELVDEDYLPLLAATLASFALVLFVLLAAFLYRHTLRVYIHSKYGVRVFDSSFSDDGDRDNVETGTLESGSNSSGSSGNHQHQHQHHQRLFDVFVSYSPKDDRFVRDVLARELEGGGGGDGEPQQSPSYRVCLHHRDLPSTSSNGLGVADAVVQAAAASRRTVIVLSENFLRSEWSRYDYKSGLHQALRSGLRRRLLVVTLGDVNSRDVDPDLRLYLKTSIVLQWGDRLFWEKLRYALPDVVKKNGGKSGSSASVASGHMLAANLQQAAAASPAASGLGNNNVVKSAGVGVSTISNGVMSHVNGGAVNAAMAAEAEGHYYHQPRYATYLPPPPPSSVSTPVPSITNGGSLINHQRMLPSPPVLQQQPQHLYTLQQPQHYHQIVMPNLPGPQVQQHPPQQQQQQHMLASSTSPNRSVVMHI